MSNVQAQTPSANQPVPAPQTPVEPTVPAVEQKYQVTPAPQPVPAPQTPVVDEQAEARIREFQAQAERNRIEAAKALQLAQAKAQEAELYRQQLQIASQQQFQQQIPVDPYSPEYQAYQRQQELAQLKQELMQENQRNQAQFVQNLTEMVFVQKNPNVDLATLKGFMQANGIASWNLDAGLKLMNPQTVQNPYANPVAQPIQPQFPQQQVQNIGAIRNGVGAVGQPIQLSFEKMLADYAKNPAVEQTWSPELRTMFWQHAGQKP